MKIKISKMFRSDLDIEIEYLKKYGYKVKEVRPSKWYEIFRFGWVSILEKK